MPRPRRWMYGTPVRWVGVIRPDEQLAAVNHIETEGDVSYMLPWNQSGPKELLGAFLWWTLGAKAAEVDPYVSIEDRHRIRVHAFGHKEDRHGVLIAWQPRTLEWHATLWAVQR
ncbi:hypothetical protein SCAR479_13594 [Seiridium cardinale]|uniref:Uncharacterized protein n=1 Tax=Seiridium cardinale TaxID=138064 RepID=A0ABR2X7G2_9PEZI